MGIIWTKTIQTNRPRTGNFQMDLPQQETTLMKTEAISGELTSSSSASVQRPKRRYNLIKLRKGQSSDASGNATNFYEEISLTKRYMPKRLSDAQKRKLIIQKTKAEEWPVRSRAKRRIEKKEANLTLEQTRQLNWGHLKNEHFL